jgi:hypothetical protein
MKAPDAIEDSGGGFIPFRTQRNTNEPALTANGGLEAMNSAETKPKELRLGKPFAGKPLARIDEGEGRVCGLPLRCSLYSSAVHEWVTASTYLISAQL